jgi:glucosamine-6-phosphate deaminase
MSINTQFEKDKLLVKIFDTRAEMGQAAAADAAKALKALLEEKDDITVIFAAAPSQNEFLAAMAKDSSIDWARINALHMDEYIGLPESAPQRFGNFLKDAIFGKVPFKSVNYIDGGAGDIEAECERYSSLINDLKPDAVFMGIGENGHIAFNDPHVAFFNDKKLVKKVKLDEACRMQQVNDGCFERLEDVPTHALTLTVPALMGAEYHFCVVPGKTKAQAVFDTLMGDISESCPASVLRKYDGCILYLDADSARDVL